MYQAVEAVFCRQPAVMQTVLKNRCLTKYEFQALLMHQFVRQASDVYGFRCVFLQGTQQLVGISGLLPCHYLNQEDVEFGFILQQAFWGRGYAKELGAFWINYVQYQLGLSRVLATAAPDNVASVKVLHSLKMQADVLLQLPDRGKRQVFVRRFSRSLS